MTAHPPILAEARGDRFNDFIIDIEAIRKVFEIGGVISKNEEEHWHPKDRFIGEWKVINLKGVGDNAMISEKRISGAGGRSKYNILDENNQPIGATRSEWEEMMKDDRKRRVAINKIENATVNTMFIGMDMGFHLDKPLLYSTVIFGGEHDGFEDRYSTYLEAVAGHLDICRALIHNNPL